MIRRIKNFLEILADSKYLSISLYVVAAVIVVINIFLIWHFQYIPFQDHPSHLLRENVMLNYNNPSFDYSRNFKFNIVPIPNILSDVIIVFFGQFFSITAASKIFYTLYLVFFPLMFFYFLRAVDKHLSGYAFIAVFFSFSYFTCMGNENFILSLVLFFVFWIMVLNEYFEKSLKHKILFFVVAALLYFAHMFTFYMACVSVLIFYFSRRDGRKFLKVLFFLLPFIILFFVWQLGSGGSIVFEKKLLSQMMLTKRKLNLITVAFDPYLSPPFCKGILCFLGLAFIWMFLKILFDKSLRIKSFFYAFLGILVHIFLPTTFLFFGPDQRAVFLAFLFGSVLLPVKKNSRNFFVTGFVLLSVFAVTQNVKYFKESKVYLDKMVPLIQKMPPKKRVLPVIFAPYTWIPFFHRIYEYYHIENGGINPYHFFTKSNLVMYKNKNFKPPINPGSPGVYPDDFFDDYDIVVIIGDKITDTVMSYKKKRV